MAASHNPTTEAYHQEATGKFRGKIPNPRPNITPVKLSPFSNIVVIPTAVVIKGIPYHVRSNELARLMTVSGLPTPWALDYLFVGGRFRGQAFANFETIEAAALVAATFHQVLVHGRTVQVQYKTVRPKDIPFPWLLQTLEDVKLQEQFRRFLTTQHEKPLSNAGLRSTTNVLPGPAGLPPTPPTSGNLGATLDFFDAGPSRSGNFERIPNCFNADENAFHENPDADDIKDSIQGFPLFTPAQSPSLDGRTPSHGMLDSNNAAPSQTESPTSSRRLLVPANLLVTASVYDEDAIPDQYQTDEGRALSMRIPYTCASEIEF